MTGGYFADASPAETWFALEAGGGAALVDVRTTAEWAFVGVPDIGGLPAAFLTVEWQSYPTMQVNPGFADAVHGALQEAGSSRDAPVYFICRSGARSASAAAALTASGYRRCFNVAGGFEGGRDAAGHRGTTEGWKAAGLKWMQP